MTHVGSPPAAEINGNRIALNALAGIPLNAIKGFRAPFLSYTSETFNLLAAAGFLYDSSTAAIIPVSDPGTDAYWPYTLDYGLANGCLMAEGICKGQPQIPGLWEVPMYAFFDERGVAGVHLMDPWLDPANGANDAATLAYMMNTFTAHYNGNRQPIGLYTHPVHLSVRLLIIVWRFIGCSSILQTTYPGVNPSSSTINMINQYLDWVQGQQGVWIVSNAQLLAWVQNPTPLSQLDSFAPLKCPTPNINPTMHICNGIPANEQGLLDECALPDYPFYTCVRPALVRLSGNVWLADHDLFSASTAAPKSSPRLRTQIHRSEFPQVNSPDSDVSLSVLVPPLPSIVDLGVSRALPVPANCPTPFWDPIAGVCLCTSSTTCAFVDGSRSIRVRPVMSFGPAASHLLIRLSDRVAIALRT